MCKAIFVHTSKTGQHDVLSVGAFSELASIMTSQVAGYKMCVVSVFLLQINVCVFLLNCDHICEPQK